jgi:diguanylate cyclase (GGDEF)-like protein
VTCANFVDDEAVAGVICNARDVTEGLLMEQRLAYEATHDPLTALANRALFDQEVQRQAERGDGPRQLVVIAIDLDDFKAVNDTYGHHVGDRLLVLVAERIRRCVRPPDLVARLGGDEFAVVIPDVDSLAGALLARRVLASFEAPVMVEGHLLAVKASAGLASGPTNEAETLLRRADLALYTAKRQGKGHVHVAPSFDTGLVPPHVVALERRLL